VRYKDQLRFQRSYEGDAPESCVEEAIPEFTGHDDSVQYPQEQGMPWRDRSGILKSPFEAHGSHPGDAAANESN
jgi:hypothetical protein